MQNSQLFFPKCIQEGLFAQLTCKPALRPQPPDLFWNYFPTDLANADLGFVVIFSQDVKLTTLQSFPVQFGFFFFALLFETSYWGLFFFPSSLIYILTRVAKWINN